MARELTIGRGGGSGRARNAWPRGRAGGSRRPAGGGSAGRTASTRRSVGSGSSSAEAGDGAAAARLDRPRRRRSSVVQLAGIGSTRDDRRTRRRRQVARSAARLRRENIPGRSARRRRLVSRLLERSRRASSPTGSPPRPPRRRSPPGRPGGAPAASRRRRAPWSAISMWPMRQTTASMRRVGQIEGERIGDPMLDPGEARLAGGPAGRLDHVGERSVHEQTPAGLRAGERAPRRSRRGRRPARASTRPDAGRLRPASHCGEPAAWTRRRRLAGHPIRRRPPASSGSCARRTRLGPRCWYRPYRARAYPGGRRAPCQRR